MSGIDRKIDFATGDFVDGANGSWTTVRGIYNMLAFTYAFARGTWEGDPEMGHLFAELDRATDTSENRERLRDLAAASAQWLIDGGFLDRVEAFVQSWEPGKVAFEVHCYEPGRKDPTVLGPFFAPVGV